MDIHVPVTGGWIWAQDTGGRGVPVVLANSDWCDCTSWDRTIGRLTGSPRVIRYDNRGYGRSPAPVASFTQAGDLAAVLDYLEVGRAVLAGHSGGGGTAIGLALARPEQVGALILAAPGVQDYPWPHDDPYLAEFGRLQAAGDRAGLVALGLATWARTPVPDRAGPDPAAQAQVRSAVAAFFRQGGYLADDPPAWPRLAEISVPAALAIGELEYPMVRDCGTAIADRIPTCRTILAPGADHLLPLSAPALLAGLIDAARASLSGHNAAPGA